MKQRHMWLNPVRYENGTFFGNINNEPDQVTTVELGDEVSVTTRRISDWMYVEDGKLKGGYTLRAMREGMSEDERRTLDRSMPFAFD